MRAKKRSRRRPFIVRRSDIHGRGAFATEWIDKGTRLIEYTGERISEDEADARYDDEDDYPRYEDAPGGGAGMALGIVSMVLGIVSVPFAIFPCLGFFTLPIAGVGLLLGLLGLTIGSSEKRGNAGFAIAGVATSGASILIALLILLAFRDAFGRHWWWL